MSRAICWIRRDLRLNDHRPLFEACARHDEVIVAFVFDPAILDRISNKENHRVTFLLESLAEVDAKLRRQGSQLLVLYGDPAEELPKAAKALDVQAVYFGRDYDPFATKRDTEVTKQLKAVGVEAQGFKDQVIFEKGEVLSKSDSAFRVFTPYSRRWLEIFNQREHANAYDFDLAKLAKKQIVHSHSKDLGHELIGFTIRKPWLEPGEDAAQGVLKDFDGRINRYGEQRDFPAVNGVSHISVHLRFGTISIRECVRMAIRHDSTGAKKWLMELIWREFYQDILANHPNVVHETFNPDYRKLDWPGSEEHFELWKAGRTGYPIVDAAMRCFARTGWMHNRLRMIVASFLTKDLLVDYKKGEAYFAAQLLDYDLASNNGGWQWASSVGCDAQPYFRIFNPYLQSAKFDPNGRFIREWLPELADLDNKSIHQPTPMDIELCGYISPIVDHEVQRKLAIRMFEAAREESD